MKSPGEQGTMWWTVEAPVVDFEEPAAFEPERSYLDGAQPLPLFKDVRITEESSSVRFDVPARIIETPEYGKWAFSAHGGRQWFKERDDYGEIRMFANDGTSIWVPHLYPFEETTEDGLPMIRDRERCKMTVKLSQLGNAAIGANTLLQSAHGQYGASESIESYNPEGIRYFNEFIFIGQSLLAELVTYPESPWVTLRDYLDDPATPETTEDYADMMLGRKPMPGDYLRTVDPDEWPERTPFKSTSEAFGAIWVPIDELRRGIEADITFDFAKR